MPDVESSPSTSVSSCVTLEVGVCYKHAIRDVKDIAYFESKMQFLTKAVGVWLDPISCNWESGRFVCGFIGMPRS